MMKIVVIQAGVNQSSIPFKLLKLYRNIGIEVKLLVLDSSVNDEDVIKIYPSLLTKILRKCSIKNSWGKIRKQKQFIDEGIPFSIITEYGIDITKNKYVKEADIIQVHWIGARYLSPENIVQLTNMGKPVVFINHDSSLFTGGCHIRLGCENFMEGCGKCPELHSSYNEDITSYIVDNKSKIDKSNSIVVSPSKWMDYNASMSMVFKGCEHHVIPNPIDTEVFKPLDKNKIRKKYGVNLEKTVLLFGAVNAVSAVHKGYDYLVSAIKKLCQLYDTSNIELVVFGSDGGDSNICNIPIRYLGKLNEEEMVEAYSLSDVYVFPSIDDNFPGTVLEASACELPVVSFTTGGVPDIVDHKVTGYLANYKDSDDLAMGIRWILDSNMRQLGKNARIRMSHNFSNDIICELHKNLFEKLVDIKRKP